MKFYAKKSVIHGKGIFTSQRIITGQVIGHFEWREPQNQEEIDGPYGLEFSKDHVVFMTCDFRYINHSKNPNICLYDDYSIIALQNIKPGEELVSDYGDKWEELYSNKDS